MRSFLVLHRWQNHRPPGHWQRWLAERLRATGEHVRHPQLPSPDAPVLEDWLIVLRSELRRLRGERVVIAHSLGCLLWLRHAATAMPEEAVDRLLLVCPPSATSLPPSLAPFHAPTPCADALARTVRGVPELVCTDADPWCPEGAAEHFGDALRLRVHVVPGAGHLSLDEGFGPWPAVERWARSGVLGSHGLQALSA
jgi:uncharacterized protein